jgi:hypothetical protein
VISDAIMRRKVVYFCCKNKEKFSLLVSQKFNLEAGSRITPPGSRKFFNDFIGNFFRDPVPGLNPGDGIIPEIPTNPGRDPVPLRSLHSSHSPPVVGHVGWVAVIRLLVDDELALQRSSSPS